MSELFVGKLASQLILPPGGLLLLALLGVVFCRRLWGRTLILLSLAALWLLSTAPVRDTLLQALEHQNAPLADVSLPADNAVIVLLGAGTRADSPEYGEDIPGRSAWLRTVYAAQLAKKSKLPLFATGGRVLKDRGDTEAEVMRRWLLRFGVNAEQIHLEHAANNTWENAVFIRQSLSQYKQARIVLVTSAWHMPRARWCFEQQGMNVIAAPTDYMGEQEEYDSRNYLPDADALAASSRALHEYLGLFWYRIRHAI